MHNKTKTNIELPQTMGSTLNNRSTTTDLSMKFILLLNVKKPTTVGILTFIGRIKTTSESFNASTIFIIQHFTFCEQLKF